ncbi:MAG: PKD domain-containing protein [Sphingobacteriales bacterium]|nr:MAG: PKD domain-containing protein [Sphingobacteriales bacterium]
MKKILLCLLLVSGSLASCSMEPTACFSVDKEKDAKVNEEVQFSAACSEDASTYKWNFGDGATAEGISVKHKYVTEGTYEVQLTALSGGVSSQSTARVIVTK